MTWCSEPRSTEGHPSSSDYRYLGQDSTLAMRKLQTVRAPRWHSGRQMDISNATGTCLLQAHPYAKLLKSESSPANGVAAVPGTNSLLHG